MDPGSGVGAPKATDGMRLRAGSWTLVGRRYSPEPKRAHRVVWKVMGYDIWEFVVDVCLVQITRLGLPTAVHIISRIQSGKATESRS